MVVTVESALADDLKKGADDYRRKDVFEFRPFNATHIEITRNGQTVAFDKVKNTGKDAQTNPDDWKRVSPSAERCEQGHWIDAVAAVEHARGVVRRVRSKTGLDKPALTVVVKFEDGKKEERVTFGQHGNDVFALRPGEPGAAKVDATDFNETIKSLDELSK